MKDKLTGLSLSFCIKDVAIGKVTMEQIKKLITGTNALNREEFEAVLKEYCETYWDEFPEEAKRVAKALWDAGLIDQPRTRGEMPPFVGQGHWINSNGDVIRL